MGKKEAVEKREVHINYEIRVVKKIYDTGNYPDFPEDEILVYSQIIEDIHLQAIVDAANARMATRYMPRITTMSGTELEE